MHRLVSELDQRYQSYDVVYENFGFLYSLSSLSLQDLHSAALKLPTKYHSDLEEDSVEEVVQFSEFLQNEKESSMSVMELLQVLRRRKLQTAFPNRGIALRYS